MQTLRNKVLLIGNLGAKPEVKKLDTGRKLATFSIATHETYLNAKGEKVTETQWHNLVAWGKLADIAEKYLDKGKAIAIEGKLVYHSFLGKGGTKLFSSEIEVTELLLLGGKSA